MRVCILSMQSVDNFGSLLQAYSLRKILKSMGHDVEFINIEEYEDDPVLDDSTLMNHQQERDKYSNNKIVSLFNKVDRYFLWRFINKIKQGKQAILFADFRKKYLNIQDDNNSKHYDVCVIGSDEVFNCLQKGYTRLDTQLFGNVKNADKIITYAASCGYTTFEHIPENLRRPISESLNKISAFSVRDENTYNFLRAYFPSMNGISFNLDPVVIGNFDEEIHKTEFKQRLPKKFCIVYSYANRIHSDNEIKSIKEFCSNKDLEIIALGCQQKWITNFKVVSPFELLKIVQLADFVITDTFHGTVFSFKYARRFGVIIRDSNRNKLYDLITRLDIRDHVIENIEELGKVYEHTNDFENGKRVSNEALENSICYLQENI